MRHGVAAVVAATLCAALAGCAGPVDLGDPDVYARELFDGTNERREAEGLEPLVWSECLAGEAEPRARNTVTTAPLDHEALLLECVPGLRAGENLARSQRTAPQIVQAWMDSPTHRANLLDEGWTQSGVACVVVPADIPDIPEAPPGSLACSQLFAESP